MKSKDQTLLEEAYGAMNRASNSQLGIAIDIYLRRENGFDIKKKELVADVQKALREFGAKVVPFSDTLSNGSSVLELTIPYKDHELTRETEPLDPEHKEDYDRALRSIGIDSFDIYPM